jgi:alginate O-acetyltransferase complex protein AlgI
MLFNSFQFLLFFPLVTLLYFLLPHRWRWLQLLVASCLFYCAFIPVYILILFFTIIIDYGAGLMIEGAAGKKRKLFLVISLLANIGVLAVFKYFNFFADNINDVLHSLNLEVHPIPLLDIILPIGLSFHTFQAMSYTIEVYRGHQPAERHLGIYALYVMFYPQLVAGPIERPQNLLHQFRERHHFDPDHMVKGLRLMLWGFFMKVVVADRLALYVDSAYNNVAEHNGTTLLLATFLFSFQIYCDFAGYSYIAIGAARTMGFKLMTNFNRPYMATSVSAFWNRWHISLSTWFRDYLYIPLGGNRVSRHRKYRNLLLVFLVSGLWHGANWTFVIWGGLNGLFLITGSILGRKKAAAIAPVQKPYRKLVLFLKTIGVFLLISFTWIFFRANNVVDAITIVKKIGTQLGERPFMIWGTLFYAAVGLFVLLFAEVKREHFRSLPSLSENKSAVVRYAYYVTLILMLLLLGVFDGGQFIYFQF